VGTRKEAVTAHVMKICWPSTVDNKQTKASAEVSSDEDEIRSRDTRRKTLCKASNVFYGKEIRECGPLIVKRTKVTIKEIL
jgi:hypothetical protein